MNYTVKIVNKDKPDCEAIDFPLCNIGIVTKDDDNPSLLGRAVLKAVDGKLYFLDTATWATPDHTYRIRPLKEGEQVILTGKFK